MIFRDNNGFKTYLVPGAINYYDKLQYLSSGQVRMYYSYHFVDYWCWYQCFIFLFLTVPIIYYHRNLS